MRKIVKLFAKISISNHVLFWSGYNTHSYQLLNPFTSQLEIQLCWPGNSIIRIRKFNYAGPEIQLFVFENSIMLARKFKYSYSKIQLCWLGNSIIRIRKFNYAGPEIQLFVFENSIMSGGNLNSETTFILCFYKIFILLKVIK